ncbi:MAG: histidine phosphatase family protein [Gammaproteobacteria bacterium]|nr:histidine phosphatase family protein [Gammaproteobacteria bacterium]
MRENLFADSFIRQVLILLLVLFFFGAAYLNSVLYNRIVLEPQAWQALDGGAVALMSHAHVKGEDDPYKFRLGDCKTQVNLSETGRNQAKRIGKRFREHGVEVGIVLHSSWCRTRETAFLAFPGISFMESSIDSFRLRPEHEAFYTRKLKEIILNWSGSNALVLMTHPENILALTGINASSGEAVVARSLKNDVEVVGRIVF